MSKHRLVVAHYKEDLSWLAYVDPEIDVLVYDKFALSSIATVKSKLLPNIGREAHTYLHHIVENYNNLDDMTTFCQGNPFAHHPPFLIELHQPMSGFRMHAHQTRWALIWNGVWANELMHLPDFYRQLFDTDVYDRKPFCYWEGAQFSVSREIILNRSLEFYKKALRMTEIDEFAAWKIERLWHEIFGMAI